MRLAAKATEYLSDLAAKRIPDAAAKALTRTAFDFAMRCARVCPNASTCAARGSAEASVRHTGQAPHPDGRGLVSGWFLALQETGGTKTGKLAIPVGPMAQTAQTRVIPKSQVAGPGDGEEERVLPGR